MLRVVLIGATGRLGQVAFDALSVVGHFDLYAYAHKQNMFMTPEGYCSKEELCSKKIDILIDASIDHSSFAAMWRHEFEKQELLKELHAQNSALKVVTFSSGCVDFDDSLIVNDYYREYKKVKLAVEQFYRNNGCQFLMIKVFTLIGPKSKSRLQTGWVSVLNSALTTGSVSVGDLHEPRSWVAEAAIRDLISGYIEEGGGGVLTPISGDFSLQQIIRFVERRNRKSVRVEQTVVPRWLTVPYVAKDRIPFDQYSLESVLETCLG